MTAEDCFSALPRWVALEQLLEGVEALHQALLVGCPVVLGLLHQVA